MNELRGLDAHITGNYGEDQFHGDDDDEYDGDETMRAKVLAILPYGPLDTVISFRARLEDGREVIAGGDHRMMRDVIAALDAGDEAEVELESWQVVG